MSTTIPKIQPQTQPGSDPAPRLIGEDDPTTRRLLERILAVEEEHAEDMKTLHETVSLVSGMHV